MSDLARIWKAQYEQQQLWHDWPALSAQERSDLTKDCLLGLIEESSELLKKLDFNKYHIIRGVTPPSPAAIAEAGVDVLKYLSALMLLHGITPEEMMRQFERKTEVVNHRWKLECDEMSGIPVLLCDLDDCIADWQGDFVRWANRHDLPLGSVNDVEAAKDHFYANGGFISMTPIKGAVETLNRWQELYKGRQKRLILLTSRPHKRHTRIYADTLEWCKMVGLVHDHIIFTHDKGDAARQFSTAKIVAMIEDRMKYAQEIASLGITVLKLPGCDDVVGFNHQNVLNCTNWNDIAIALNVSTPER